MTLLPLIWRVAEVAVVLAALAWVLCVLYAAAISVYVAWDSEDDE